MITHFGDRRLRLLHERSDRSRLPPHLVKRTQKILDDLDQAATPADMEFPGYRLHPLRGQLDGFWAVSVSGNWRIIFRFDNSDVRDVRLIDYH